MRMMGDEPPGARLPGRAAEIEPDACADLAALAWAYLDNEVSWSDQRWIRRHIVHCEHCRTYLYFQRAFLRALRAELKREVAGET